MILWWRFSETTIPGAHTHTHTDIYFLSTHSIGIPVIKMENIEKENISVFLMKTKYSKEDIIKDNYEQVILF